VTVTMTLPAPPEAYLETGLLPATRHRVVAVGSGLGGLTATRALKHDLANIADAVVFLTRMAAQGTSHVVSQTSPWVQVIPATTAVLTTFGVFVTLHVTVARGWKTAPHTGRNHRTQIDALYSADRRRYEISAAASHSSCNGCLWRSRRTSKGWF
jgi:monoamine oxidase